MADELERCDTDREIANLSRVAPSIERAIAILDEPSAPSTRMNGQQVTRMIATSGERALMERYDTLQNVTRFMTASSFAFGIVFTVLIWPLGLAMILAACMTALMLPVISLQKNAFARALRRDRLPRYRTSARLWSIEAYGDTIDTTLSDFRQLRSGYWEVTELVYDSFTSIEDAQAYVDGVEQIMPQQPAGEGSVWSHAAVADLLLALVSGDGAGVDELQAAHARRDLQRPSVRQQLER
jgi:hypothetical protein